MARIAALSCAVALAVAGRANAQTDKQVAARLTPTVRTCEKLPENGGTLEQAFCYKDEAARQDRRLNETWAQIMGRASPARKLVLRQSEWQWLKGRDKDCHEEAAEYINSTAAYMFNLCMANETIRRTMWLEKAR